MTTRIIDTAKTLAVALLLSVPALPAAAASSACGVGASADQADSYWSRYWEQRSQDGQ